VVVVPSHVIRETTAAMAGRLESGDRSGVGLQGHREPNPPHHDRVLKETLGVSDDRLAVLSGPSFAVEVARKLPTVVTVASRNPALAQITQQVFATPYFRSTPARTPSASSSAGR